MYGMIKEMFGELGAYVMLIGYMRPYQDDITCKNQKNALMKIKCEQIISEAHSSAKRREKLEAMLENLHEGDTIVITKLFALADSTRHLVELLEMIETKGAYILSLSEKIDTSREAGYRFTEIVKHLVEFQADVISEKTKEGLHEAKQKGINAGRPKKPDANVQRAIEMYQSKKYSLDEIRSETGISKSTLYRYMEN